MIKNKEELMQTKNFAKLVKLNGFLKVPFHFATYFDLNPTETMIFCFIHNATHHLPEKAFTDTETTLQCLCNVSKSHVQKSLQNLLNKGLIERFKRKYDNGRIITAYRSLKAIQLKIKHVEI